MLPAFCVCSALHNLFVPYFGNYIFRGILLFDQMYGCLKCCFSSAPILFVSRALLPQDIAMFFYPSCMYPDASFIEEFGFHLSINSSNIISNLNMQVALV
jgi:hypothetical protein